jgi:hypothetical protein
MNDPTRRKWADTWMQCLPIVTQGMKESAEKYAEGKFTREQFLTDCDAALERLKALEEQED